LDEISVETNPYIRLQCPIGTSPTRSFPRAKVCGTATSPQNYRSMCRSPDIFLQSTSSNLLRTKRQGRDNLNRTKLSKHPFWMVGFDDIDAP